MHLHNTHSYIHTTTTTSPAPPIQLDGRSLVRLLRGEAASGAFDAAFTQIARQDSKCVSPDALAGAAHALDSDPPASSLHAPGAAANCTMGLSVRVHSWRYAAWVDYNYGTPTKPAGPRWSAPGAIRGEELYDHTADDEGGGSADNNMDTSELVNVAGMPAYAAIQAQLRALVVAEFPEGGW